MHIAITTSLAVFAGVTSLAAVPPAVAMGGFSCNVQDKAIKLRIESGLSGAGGALFNFKGQLDVLSPATPKPFGAEAFDGSQVMHSWFDGKDLKLEIYREREPAPFGSLKLVIETTRVDEGLYTGTYVLTIDRIDDGHSDVQTTEAHGALSCTVD